ncbi:MAG: 5-dehydro-2-deoxygluconokinase [Methylobacteriaceae bacterium]|nr:5-dehydro-2-deoxygluconokinase [Methylobacteriaceae bacterium]
MAAASLDVITIGRSSVDLYGQQIGGALEDMASFSKAVGGSPTNIAIGVARLGLKSGLITRVGDEHFGRFIREQLVREGVDVTGVRTDPNRLTALAILGVRDDRSFPLIFYRDNCADGALDETDIEESHIAQAKAVVVTGTHFAKEASSRAQRLAMSYAKAHGCRVGFDIDYRPNLWGLAGHGAGEQRYIRSGEVTQHLQSILPGCDLVVGTEEELMIAGGHDDVLASIRAVRKLTAATIVCKRGPTGCVVFPADIPSSIEDGIKGPGFPVEVYNTLGAGDAFMAGFLRGWLTDAPIETCCTYANAGGAFAVSRLLCSVEYPTFAELSYFLQHGSRHRALRQDATLNHMHWATTRASRPRGRIKDTLVALAIDHRPQFEKLADAAGASRARIPAFKRLAVEAAAKVAAADGHPQQTTYGMLLDGTYGREALFRAEDHGLWIARPVEAPGSRPLEFEGGGSLAARVLEWPAGHAVKCLCFYHPDDPPDLKARQQRELSRVQDVALRLGRELLVEIIASKHGRIDAGTVAGVLSELYASGINPDWWKLEPQASEAVWANIGEVIAAKDPLCRGILLLGLEAPQADLEAALRVAAAAPLIKGFAIGRTIFAEPAQAWFAGKLSDKEAVDRMAGSFAGLAAAWQEARATTVADRHLRV